MIPGTFLLAGCALLGVGVACALRGPWLARSLALQALGTALLGLGGAVALVDGEPAGAAFSGGLSPALGVDALSGLFLAALGCVGTAALLHARGSLAPGRQGSVVAALSGVFVLVLALVLCARDVTTFLAGWELMTLVPAAIILVARSDAVARQTVFTYVAITHLGGVGVWIALLELVHLDAVDDPAALAAHGQGATIAIALAALVGFGTKAGLMPLHAWLPRTHPIAPPHVSALMSGVMLKVALYGLVRVLIDWSPALPTWFGALVVGLGALSALAGATYAVFAGELKRLLAWSSVENVGVIVLGLGAALLLREGGDVQWASLALGAALLHTLNHAVFKALLFLGAGSLARAVGPLDLDRLGGLLTRMPRTGWALVLGAVALAGVPPLNGFASEWLTLQALLHVAAPEHVGSGLVGVLALATLAMTAALTLLCVVRLLGLVLLGPPRTDRARAASEVPASMWGPTAALAAACGVLGVLPGLVLPSLTALLPGAPSLARHPGLDLPGTGSLPTLGIAVGLVVVGLVAWRAARAPRAAPAPTWACGQPVEPTLLWSSAGFTKPLRLIGEPILRPEREIVVTRSAGIVRSVSYRGRVPLALDAGLYAPARRVALSGAHHARRLQSGRIGAYVGYLIGLVVLLLAAARIGVFG